MQSLRSLFHLTWNLARRDVAMRFRGSLLGSVWLIINPLFTLGLYYYVFSFIFKARWEILRPDGQPAESPTALVLFVGLIAFLFFSECLLRAPGLIRENPSYVKKIIFPLEVLPLMAVLSALFTAAVNSVLLLVFYVFAIGLPSWHILLAPLVFLPLVLGSLGVVYGVSALSVYLPDLKSLMGPISMAFMFMTPIMYPISIIPADLRTYIYLNPLTGVVEQLRGLIFGHALPSFSTWVQLLAASLVILGAGYFGFSKLRKGFADVL